MYRLYNSLCTAAGSPLKTHNSQGYLRVLAEKVISLVLPLSILGGWGGGLKFFDQSTKITPLR